MRNWHILRCFSDCEQMFVFLCFLYCIVCASYCIMYLNDEGKEDLYGERTRDSAQ